MLYKHPKTWEKKWNKRSNKCEYKPTVVKKIQILNFYNFFVSYQSIFVLRYFFLFFKFFINKFLRINLKLSAVGNNDFLSGGSALATDFLDVSNNVHTFADLAKNDVFTVQPRSNGGGNKKLATIGVWSAVGHGQQTWSNVLSDKVLVGKFLAVDALSAGSVLSSEIAALAHKAWNDSVEGTAFVAHAFFSGAQGSEVFNGFWHIGVVHVKDDSSGVLAANGHVEKAFDRHCYKGLN